MPPSLSLFCSNIVAFREHSDEAQLRRAAEAEGVTYDLAHVVWTIVRRETARDALDEPLLSSFLHACILSHATLEDTLAFVLSKRLARCACLSSAGRRRVTVLALLPLTHATSPPHAYAFLLPSLLSLQSLFLGD